METNINDTFDGERYIPDFPKYYIRQQQLTDHTILIVLNLYRGGSIEIIANWTVDDANHVQERLLENYNKLLDQLSSSDLSLINQAYDSIAVIGKFLYNKLFSSATQEQRSFLDTFFAGSRKNLGFLEILETSWKIPYEFLCCHHECTDKKNHFLGTKYIISRKKIQSKTRLLINKPPSIAYTGTDLKAFNLELENFVELEKINAIKRIDLSSEQHTNKKYLISEINKADYDILHIACHIIHDENPLNSLLAMRKVDLTLVDINTLISKLDGKLIFLNGCKSGNNKAESTLSFSNEFVEKGAACVISVTVNIPDTFAAEFASMFYFNFVQSPQTIDYCLYYSTMHFIDKYNNPSGLFYSLYGSTGINN